MSHSSWLQNKTALHSDAQAYAKMRPSMPSGGLEPLHLVSLAESNQMCIRYALPVGMPSQLFMSTKDPNMDTWGLYEYPVI